MANIALQMNALERLNLPYDSTLDMARAAAEAGHKLFHYRPENLRMEMKQAKKGEVLITARGNALLYNPKGKVRWSLGKESVRDLGTFDVILMRQDPPFDLSYIAATHILDHLSHKVKVVNDPTGVRDAPEKLLVTQFPHLMPPTLVTRDREAIENFRAEHKNIVVKPLFGYAGHGIFHIRPGDDNLPALIETQAALNNEPWMIQKYLPIAKVGDKRILFVDGEPVGIYVRYPLKGDMRGNMRVGATAEKTKYSKRDIEICDEVGPVLQEMGLYFAGIDVIGNYLTEINVTSPTGIVVADKLQNHTGNMRIAERFWLGLGL